MTHQNHDSSTLRQEDEPGPDEGGSEDTPARIGRYRVKRRLGQGGFGVVYLAQDEQLCRPVAVKVPHGRLVSRPDEADAYLAEARTVARLDHPHIVPVYDVGSTEEYPCFVVSKYIKGCTLAQTIRDGRPSVAEAVELVATIAEALHYAHKQGLVHRDIKPGNILLDQGGRPFLADFGLALRERDVGKGPRYAGTPPYMSPEQARGEGHRVDGRSDLFSLGVVLYELLTGRRPFRGETRDELLEQIAGVEARPLRQIDDRIPKEVERICLKALAKRAADRYTTARDLADDLRHFLAAASPEEKSTVTGRGRPEADLATPMPSPGPTPSDRQATKVVPKGLRAFDAHDADFFLELLPGPRDRTGLPESVRFWKTRIEESDPDNTFAVGLLYGPSGCGKSSLVRAGLLPRLAGHVVAVYVEATGTETEARLLRGLGKHCPDLPAGLGLVETVAAVRLGWGLPAGQKALLVLDQFEQWLHARGEEEHTELVQALRQCDGTRVQAFVLVRDDFWMAATRFLRELEVRLVEGHNSAAVDLFDLRHARRVLAAFGRAFGALPETAAEQTKEQDAFLDQAVAGLAEERRVFPVRLVVFAEMAKGRPWTPATLREVGGAAGVGVTFLEETFSAAAAPPEHRYHQRAVRAVLKALLPEFGTDIKGGMRPRHALLAAAGYGDRPDDFEALLRILDGELRLITPTDPEGMDPATGPGPVNPAERYYQLTHDYLVHSLRDWLTRKQKETRQGRAELLLADRAGVWNARPENRQLPSLWQWLQIRWWTRKKDWTPPQRKMMRQAGRFHALRGLAAVVLLALVGWGVFEGHGRLQAHALLGRLLDASTSEVPAIVQGMGPYRRWLDPHLRDAYARAEANRDARKQLHTSLALLPVDATQVEHLYGRLLEADPHEVQVIRDALVAHRSELAHRLWAVVARPEKGREHQRLRAAAALATYDPDSPQWDQGRKPVANDLVSVPAVYSAVWMESFRPVRDKLLAPLAVAYCDIKRRETERSLATDLLADYAADQPQLLAGLLMDADGRQFGVLFPVVNHAAGPSKEVSEVLQAELRKKPGPGWPEADRARLARRQATAGAALLRLGRAETVWELLRHSEDPTCRSYLVQRLAPLGVAGQMLVERLKVEPDVSARRALVLSLGEYTDRELPAEVRTPLVSKLLDWYENDPDPGMHAAIDWLLRHGKEGPEPRKLDWGQARKLEEIDARLRRRDPDGERRWYVNRRGQTYVCITLTGPFHMGSVGGPGDEKQHWRLIPRSFALASRPVTVADFGRFLEERPDVRLDPWTKYSPYPDGPIINVSWFVAAQYCNWLSEKEGLPESEWCYPRHADIKEGMKLDPDYLKRQGYRLPTEAEWEYAARAGSESSRYYGSPPDLLPRYAWYIQNAGEHTLPVGQKRPNDFGLFDALGNVWNWVQDRYRPYPQAETERAASRDEGGTEVIDGSNRVMRGGSFLYREADVRSAFRNNYPPSTPDRSVGLRPARTLPGQEPRRSVGR